MKRMRVPVWFLLGKHNDLAWSAWRYDTNRKGHLQEELGGIDAMLTNLSLFSGAGVLDLAAKWTGKIRTVAYVECDPYAQGVLLSRMRDGSLDDAPIFEDIKSFDGRSLEGSINIVSGGFPCQDVSVAGKRIGIRDGIRSGLWSEFARIIREVRPRCVLVENVPGLLIYPGAGVVLRELAVLGFDAEWRVLSAAEVGAPHLRNRVWIIGYSRGSRWSWKPWPGTEQKSQKGAASNSLPAEQRRDAWKSQTQENASNSARCSSKRFDKRQKQIEFRGSYWRCDWIEAFSKFCRVDDGLANRVDKIRLCGNGVVPQQSLPAWEKIIEMSELK